MKKSMRFASAVLAALLLSVTAGCAKTPSSSTAGENASSTTGSTAESTFSGEPDEIVLKTYHGGYEGNEEFYNTPVGQEILAKTHVKVKVLSTNSEKIGAEAFVMDAASGNLADVMMFAGWDETSMTALKKAGLENKLEDMKDAIANSGDVLSGILNPDTLPLYLRNIVFDQDFGGKLYIIPNSFTTEKCWSSGNGLFIREDIAKSLNISTPDTSINTMEDLYNVLKKIKDSSPKDINGSEAYPMGGLPGIGKIETRPCNLGGNSHVAVIDGKVTGMVESTYATEKIKWVRKMLQDGLIDPEAITQSWDRSLEKISQGKYVVFPQAAVFASRFTWAPTVALYKSNPEMQYVSLGNMQNAEGKKTFTVNIAMEAGLPLVVRKGANTDAIIRLFNYICDNDGKSTVFFGKQGEQWDYNSDGFAQISETSYKEYAADSTAFNAKYGTGMLLNFCNIPGDNAKYNKQFPEADKKDSIFVYTDSAISYKYYYDQDYVTTLTKMVNDSTPEREYVSDKLPLRVLYNTFPGKDKLDTVWQKFDETFERAYLAGSDQEADKILKDYINSLNACGYQEYLSYLQKMYDSNPGVYAEEEGD